MGLYFLDGKSPYMRKTCARDFGLNEKECEVGWGSIDDNIIELQNKFPLGSYVKYTGDIYPPGSIACVIGHSFSLVYGKLCINVVWRNTIRQTSLLPPSSFERVNIDENFSERF